MQCYYEQYLLKTFYEQSTMLGIFRGYKKVTINLLMLFLKDVCSSGQTKTHMSHMDMNRVGKFSEHSS